MILTNVEIDPIGPALPIDLSFKDPRTMNPFNVKNIVGLDADSIISRYYGTHGDAKFYRLSVERRDLVVQVGLTPRFHLGESYSSLRDQLYKTIASSRSGIVVLNFKNGETVKARLEGFITKVEADQFERTQEVQITIRCEDPVLRQPVAEVNSLAGNTSAHLTILDDLSTAPHGLYLRYRATTPTPNFVLGDPNADAWTFTAIPASGFATNDRIHISSEHNDKQLYIDRNGTIIQLADKIQLGSVWPIVFPGTNYYGVLNNPTHFAIEAAEYHPAYWGV